MIDFILPGRHDIPLSIEWEGAYHPRSLREAPLRLAVSH